MRLRLSRAACACLPIILTAVIAPAQTPVPSRQSQQAPPTTRGAESGADGRANADESFDLRITERRITERDYEASTEVQVGGEAGRGLNLRVGVMVGGEEIDVLLRNVFSRVRFRATLDPVLRLLHERRPAGARQQPPQTGSPSP